VAQRGGPLGKKPRMQVTKWSGQAYTSRLMIRASRRVGSHSLTPDSDEALVARLCAGEGEALDGLMARHASALVTFCACYLDRDGAEDAAQETFVRVFLRCRTMKPNMRFKPWLYGIARNLCVSALRRRRFRAAIPVEALAEPADPPEDRMLERERRRAVLGEVDSLPTKYRDVMVLHYVSGLTCEETAAALGLKTSAVKMRLHRAVLAIREALNRGGIVP
jgi:RNA polymerase sigma-70 factor (ECF subfamily)